MLLQSISTLECLNFRLMLYIMFPNADPTDQRPILILPGGYVDCGT